MSQPPADKPSPWSELAVLALLGVLVALGLAANHRTGEEWLIALSFLAAVLGLARLMQQTAAAALRDRSPPATPAEEARPSPPAASDPDSTHRAS